MAAFSKTGAEDPVKKKDETGGGEEPLVLLPPSAFQVPMAQKLPNPKEDLSRAKAEIQKLKADIKVLREMKASEVIPHHETSHPQTSMVTPRSLPMEDSRYADVLIQRQSQEIWELKAQLSTAQAALLDHSADWEQQLSSRQREHRQVVASLEAALQDRQDLHDRQMDRLTEEHRREMEDLTCRVTELTSELAAVKEQHLHEVGQLRLEMSRLSESGQSRIQALEQETRDKDMEIRQLECKVTQLKTYIGEAELEHCPTEVRRTQNRTLENQVKLLTAEKENLESTMSLLNVRLESLTEMMTVQETELSKTKGEKSEKKRGQMLLTRWREKVFALLVQQKSSEMVMKKENQNWNTKMQDMEEKLQSAHKCTELLSHALAEKDAQLKIDKLNVSRLMEELNRAQSVAIHLDDQRAVDLEHTHSLQSAVSQLQHRMDSCASELQDALSQLDTYGHRISFASGRLQMLQGQFARREALLRLELMEAGRPQQEEDCCSAKHLAAAELERVQRERDALSAQIKADASTFQERLTTALSHSEEEVGELQSKVTELESLVLDKSKACEQLSSQVQELQTQLEDTEHRAESLSTDLARQQLLLSQAVEDQKVEDEARHREQLTELEQQLNDVRREQTKAVVSLHQAERREHREQERAANHLRTVEAHYQRQVDRLQSTLRAIEKERNLMMATLRQEGLMSKVHLERGEPIKLDWDCLELPPLPATATSAAPDKESVKSVIEDLKSLTAAVLQEDDNSSEPDE